MRLLLFSWIFILCSCTNNHSAKETKDNKQLSKKIFPVFVNKTHPNSMHFFEEKYITYCDLYSLATFNLSDSIFVDSFDLYKEKRIIELGFRKIYHEQKEIDTLARNWKRNGFKVYADFNQTIIADFPKVNSTRNKNCSVYFPFFIYNNTSDTFLILENRIVDNIIQEAFYKGKWYPIEEIKQWGCLLQIGIDFDYLPPNKTNVYLIPKYKGNCTTHLRIKCEINGKVLTSNIYSGTIDTAQLYFEKGRKKDLEKNSKGWNREIKTVLREMFLGNLPLEYSN